MLKIGCAIPRGAEVDATGWRSVESESDFGRRQGKAQPDPKAELSARPNAAESQQRKAAKRNSRVLEMLKWKRKAHTLIQYTSLATSCSMYKYYSTIRGMILALASEIKRMQSLSEKNDVRMGKESVDFRS